ncbi:DUF6257 family protein [Streptomyces sp. SID12501]|uniref:Uncharacterized protein n=1 Tax=Streptomyces sp. SID12501 TaxID=2706042 RepID=A0A6B3C784_9ACTN|nr:DUF6257 family protein [Streptomyces sp. SID12501]NEC92182.1 hypothetical protein [Streptomyces sp. SID12501]
MSEPKLTAWEKAQIIRLELIGAKRAFALGDNQPDIVRKVQRIRDRAAKRASGTK